VSSARSEATPRLLLQSQLGDAGSKDNSGVALPRTSSIAYPEIQIFEKRSGRCQRAAGARRYVSIFSLEGECKIIYRFQCETTSVSSQCQNMPLPLALQRIRAWRRPGAPTGAPGISPAARG
jgi:hypothetical protein